MTLCKLLSLHLVLVLCVGCATSEMTIHVDMYDENPKIEPLLTPSQAEQMILNTQKLAVAAQQDYSHRLYVNTRAVELYTSAWQGAGGLDYQINYGWILYCLTIVVSSKYKS